MHGDLRNLDLIPWVRGSQDKFWNREVTSGKGKFGEEESHGCEG